MQRTGRFALIVTCVIQLERDDRTYQVKKVIQGREIMMQSIQVVAKLQRCQNLKN